MADEEVDILLKITSDVSGAEAAKRELQSIREAQASLQQQSSGQGLPLQAPLQRQGPSYVGQIAQGQPSIAYRAMAAAELATAVKRGFLESKATYTAPIEGRTQFGLNPSELASWANRGRGDTTGFLHPAELQYQRQQSARKLLDLRSAMRQMQGEGGWRGTEEYTNTEWNLQEERNRLGSLNSQRRRQASVKSVMVGADLQGLSIRQLRPAETRVQGYSGLGIGVDEPIPLGRIQSVHSIGGGEIGSDITKQFQNLAGISPAVERLRGIRAEAPKPSMGPDEAIQGAFQKEVAAQFRTSSTSAAEANISARLFIDELRKQGTYEDEIKKYQESLVAKAAQGPPPPRGPRPTAVGGGAEGEKPYQPSQAFATLVGAAGAGVIAEEGIQRFPRTADEERREKEKVSQDYYRNLAREARPVGGGEVGYEERRRQQATYDQAMQRAIRERRVSPYGPQGPQGPGLLPQYEEQVPQILHNQIQLQDRDLLRRFGPGIRLQQMEQTRSQRLLGGFQNLLDRRGTAEEVAPEEDPRRQQQLYQMRAAQQRTYAQALQRAARERRVTPEGPQGPGGPPTPPGVSNAAAGGGGGGGFGGFGGGGLNPTPANLIRFGVAAGFGGGLGISVFATAGRALHQTIADIIDQEIRAVQTTRDLTAAFGAQATTWERFTRGVAAGGAGAGLFKESDVRGVVSGLATVQQNLRLSDANVRQLVTDAARLADIRSIPLVDASAALTSALEGNAGAAEKLGLNLSDVQVAAQYANGAFATTFSNLSDSEKAAARLAVANDQLDKQSKNLAGSQGTLAGSIRGLQSSWEAFWTNAGSAPYSKISGGIDLVATALGHLKDAQDEGAVRDQATLNWFKALGDYADKAKNAAGDVLKALAQNGPPGRVDQAISEVPNKVGAPPVFALGPSRAMVESLTQLQDLKESMDQYSRATVGAKTTTASLSETFAKFAQDSGAISNQLKTITDAVTNISALTPAQRGILALGQAEQAVLKQRQLGEQAVTIQQYSQMQGVQDLVGMYDKLVDAQSRRAELQQQSTILAGQEAEATERNLGAQYRLQDIQRGVQINSAVSRDIFRPAAERGQALIDAYRLKLQEPGATVSALRGEGPIIAVKRQEELNALLERIAAAAEAGVQQNINLVISGAVQVNLSGSGAQLIPADQADRIAASVAGQTKKAFAAARQAGENTASPSLAGARVK